MFHTLDHFELDFPFDGACKFKGLEEDGEIVTQPKRVRAAYLEEVQKFLMQIKEALEKFEADYVLVDTSRPVDTVLAEYLIIRTHAHAR